MNKKIKNATSIEYNGIKFRSKLEVTVYKAIMESIAKDSNIKNIQYEPERYVIWEGFKPKLPFYIKDKRTRTLKNDNTKLISITYKPDITFEYKNKYVIIEVKPAFCNDVFPYKRKLFRQCLEKLYEEGKIQSYPIYAQISSRKDMLELIKILQDEKS